MQYPSNMRCLCFLACLVLAVSAAKKRYDGYQVLEVVPQTTNELQYLRDLMFEQTEWDFWMEPSRINKPVQVMLAPQNSVIFKRYMARQSLSVNIIRENVQTQLDAYDAAKAAKPDHFDYDYSDYNTYDDYMTELTNLATNNCPAGKTCTIVTIGTSTEGRNIDAMTIVDDTDAKEWFWMDSCIHAREWLACATLMNVVNMLMTEESARPQLDAYNWAIVPMMNPDGYSFTWTGERFWRKSRNENEGSTCIGTDLNRNYDFDWNTGGSSSSPCSDTYHGSSAGSEPETQAVQDYAVSLQGTASIAGWLSFHTNGQWWLEPYGNCTTHHEWGNDISAVGVATCAAIMDTFNTNWDCGNSCVVLYATSGTTADWALGAGGVKYSYTPELRGPGFDPPVSEIDPSFEEIWNGLVAKIAAIAEIENRK